MSTTSGGHRLSHASAPGKIILMGEHAAVYGYPALVAALDLRTEASVFAPVPSQPEGVVVIDLPDLGVCGSVAWDAIDRLGEAASLQSRRHLEQGAPFVSLADLDFGSTAVSAESCTAPESLYVQIALATVSRFLANSRQCGLAELERRGIGRLLVTSRAPQSAGCGSSAAVAATSVAALLAAFSSPGEVDREDVARLTTAVERTQHGRPSGIDGATVIRGGVLRIERRAMALHIESCAVEEGVLSGFRLVHTGAASEPTGAVVDAVRRARVERGEVVNDLLALLGRSSDDLATALGAGNSAAIGPLIGAGERALEALGVVPANIEQLVRQIEARGAWAKVSGAGSKGGPGAGVLLVYDPESIVDLRRLAADVGAHLLDGSLGAPGLTVEAD